MTNVSGLAVTNSNVLRLRPVGPGGDRFVAATAHRPTGYRLMDTTQSSERGGRQVAAPTSMYIVFLIIETQYSDKNVKKHGITEQMYCRGGNLLPATFRI